jgi:hypothetical protein
MHDRGVTETGEARAPVGRMGDTGLVGAEQLAEL